MLRCDAVDRDVHRWRSVLRACGTRCIDASRRCPNPHTHATHLDDFPNPGWGSFCSVAPLLRGVMNENAAPHLLFGPITSLQSLQRFKGHPNPAAARKQIGGKQSVPALLEQKNMLLPQMMALGVNGGHVTWTCPLRAYPHNSPHPPLSASPLPPPRLGATRGPDNNPAFAAGLKQPITEKEVR